VHLLLASILRQLYETSPGVFVDTESLHARHEKHRTSPKCEEIEEVLRNSIAKCHKAYIILDALDKYIENFSNRAIRELLNVLQGLGRNVKLMVTSRVLGAMERIFKQIHAKD
jgi:archaellum biogenesis ATPase FlaH